MRCAAILALGLATGMLGCAPLGPRTVPRDRFDYNMAVADSWKEQTLLNIVKLRYADMPLFVDVASIVSGYTLEGAVSLSGTAASKGAALFNAGASATYTDRPTVTYAPITGGQFNRSFMTPIPPRAILFLMQSGWSVELLFPIAVESVSGLRSRVEAGSSRCDGDPDFYRLIVALRKVQESGTVGMRILKEGDDKESTVLFFHTENLDPEVDEALRTLSDLLRIDSTTRELRVTYGRVPQSEGEVTMLTRSLLQMMIHLAAQIDVPPEHIADGRTVPTMEVLEEEHQDVGRLINIHSDTKRPDDAFSAVRYKDHWFWIDDRDFLSKRTFGFLMILFSLTETGGKEGLPLVTIPTG